MVRWEGPEAAGKASQKYCALGAAGVGIQGVSGDGGDSVAGCVRRKWRLDIGCVAERRPGKALRSKGAYSQGDAAAHTVPR